jgi:hypothetical protein
MMIRIIVSALGGGNMTMMNHLIIPYFIDEDGAYRRGIKSGWYAINERGTLSFGPYSSREECADRICPIDGDTPNELWLW